MAEILIYDEIGGMGMRAADFIAQIRAIPAGEEVLVRINSPGGSITDGIAIHNELRRRPGAIASVDGLCASIATVIALGAARVTMADGAMWMIHNAQWFAEGDAGDLRDAADTLEKFQEAAISAYVRKTGLGRDKIVAMMDKETWLTAKEALAIGFVDEITEPLTASNKARALKHARKCNLTRALSVMSAEPTTIPEPATDPVEPVTDPAATIDPAAEPAPTDVTPPEPDPVAQTDALVAKFRDQAAQLISATQRAADLETETITLKAKITRLEAVAENFERLKASVGLAPAKAVPVITPAQGHSEEDELIAKWKGATGAQRSRLWQENEALCRKLSGENKISF